MLWKNTITPPGKPVQQSSFLCTPTLICGTLWESCFYHVSKTREKPLVFHAPHETLRHEAAHLIATAKETSEEKVKVFIEMKKRVGIQEK